MGVILCEFESRPPHPDTREEISKEVSSLSFLLFSEDSGNEVFKLLFLQIVCIFEFY